jgi:ATP-dependent helicase HrpA
LNAAPLNIEFPEALPVSARRDEIAKAIAEHQVVIVCGETGSGKTTQLPKVALAMGRGRMNFPPGQGKLIGHTQPRRIAATSVAKRIAQELGTPPGEVVGYKVRFQDRLARAASVKLMTDGILLAETQSDPLLLAYDTLIIDEAHERSLNIDFLLGYLVQLLPRRPDLRVVVTSATIDAERFAQHFATNVGPAPVIQVSGRLFPVEQRYRPFEETRDYGLNEAIADAVDELWAGAARGASGDILVFLPGEREIREAAEHLRGHLSHHPAHRNAEILPLFARLSQAEQERVFEPQHRARIVLATNVAETSLTVPGIRYVVDPGLARVKRYSYRSKVEQLLVEPISQASSNQRAGRCGRVADGICIRLYDAASFESRPRFTDPEILRSSLAAVILRMKSLRLGEVENFPFVQAPPRRAVADGYQLLVELGAVDEANALTEVGAQLARLPLDPRVGRMLLEAKARGALDEVLVIASALSVQDVRDRPLEAQSAADQAHARFDDEKSEFAGYLKLWKWLGESRGGKAGDQTSHKLSNRQHEQLLRQSFVNMRRVREWRDVHSQLLSVVAEMRWPINPAPASYEQLHLSLLAGLLGNVGNKLDDEEVYLGARGIRFYRHPGAHLSKKPGRWLMCAELVETTRLFGRGIAAIDPAWLEQVGAHLLNKQLQGPHWEKKAAEVVAFERATLYGLLVYSGRRVGYARADPQQARSIMIREALVGDEAPLAWDQELPFLPANRRLIAQVEELEHKSRRQDVLVDDELIYGFYDQQIPADVCTGQQLVRWFREASRQHPKLLLLTRDELMRHEAAGVTTQSFPRTVRLGGVDCSATYLHEPGDAKDGLSVAVPLFVLNQVNEERCEWLVPGMLGDKVLALLKTLPQKSRGRLVPLSDSAARLSAVLCEPHRFGAMPLADALLRLVREQTQLDVKAADFKPDMLSPHLFMHFRVLEEHGRQLGQGRSLPALKAEFGAQARGAFQALAGLKGLTASTAQAGLSPSPSGTGTGEGGPRPGLHPSPLPKGSGVAQEAGVQQLASAQRHTSWTFGELPELLEIGKGAQTVLGFPALMDLGDAVALEVFDEPDAAAVKHRAGLRRLFALQVKDALRQLEKGIPELKIVALQQTQVGGTAEGLKEQVVEVALERAFLAAPLPRDQASFKRCLDEGRPRLTLIAQEVARLASSILQDQTAVVRRLRDLGQQAQAQLDMQQQLQHLLPRRFLACVPWPRLQHYQRYLKAIALRLDKLRADPARDQARLAELAPLEQRYWRLLAQRKGVVDERMDEYRWLLEELRVSFFAQELRTPQPVSAKRLDRLWALLSG